MQTDRAALLETRKAKLRKEYGSIFDQRGHDYHQAMIELPDARREEFGAMLETARPLSGEVLCDLPSGGGYVHRYLEGRGVDLVSVETSEVFYQLCRDQTQGRVAHCPLDELVLETGSVDVAMSLAGLHHIEDQRPIYRELHRVLRPQGRLALGDVREGSAVDRFLNEFVHEHSQLGHVGLFFNEEKPAEVEAMGFRVLRCEVRSYRWHFPDRKRMAWYCQRLFGIDLIGIEEISRGIEKILGFEEDNDGCHMHWELMFIEAERV